MRITFPGHKTSHSPHSPGKRTEITVIAFERAYCVRVWIVERPPSGRTLREVYVRVPYPSNVFRHDDGLRMRRKSHFRIARRVLTTLRDITLLTSSNLSAKTNRIENRVAKCVVFGIGAMNILLNLRLPPTRRLIVNIIVQHYNC